LAAVLNVTTSRPGALEPHALLRELLVATATRIENLWFERRYQSAGCLLRLSRFRDFNDISAEARIALDASGQVIGATANAKSTLTMVEAAPSLIGQTSSRLLGIQDRQLFEHEDGSIQLMHDDGKHIYLKSLKTRRRPERPVQRTRPQTGERQAPDIEMVVDGNPELLRQIRMAQKLVNRRLPILIQGDTGTGKTVLARALHDRSIHAAQKFVPVNCAAIPGELIESELFGYRPGAFTGAARQGSRGLILEADGGTLFLDEVGDMPLALQSRLLHVLSNGEFVPLGGGAPIKVSIAVISATLHDLTSCVRRGVFREDLYFRLAGATLIMPPLRERADRAQLIQSVLAAEALDAGRPGLRLSPEVDRLLLRHAWPGNLRELQHLMRYAVTVCDGDVIDATCLPRHLTGPLTEGPQHAKAMEREGILRMLERCAWNISAAAQHLGISRATLHRRILRFNLERPSR
jgi:transcriptional regulator of acetoin/glycerol metabolism